MNKIDNKLDNKSVRNSLFSGAQLGFPVGGSSSAAHLRGSARIRADSARIRRTSANFFLADSAEFEFIVYMNLKIWHGLDLISTELVIVIFMGNLII